MGCTHSMDGYSALQGNKLVTSYDKVTQRHQAERGGQTQRLLPISDTLQKADLQGQKIHQWLLGAGGGKSGWTSKEPEGAFLE